MDSINEPYIKPLEVWGKTEISLAELTALQNLANNEPTYAVDALRSEYNALLLSIANFCKGSEQLDRPSFIRLLRYSNFIGNEDCWAGDKLLLESQTSYQPYRKKQDFSKCIYDAFEGMIKLPLDYIYHKKKALLPEMVEWQKNKARLNAVSMAIGNGTLRVVYP